MLKLFKNHETITVAVLTAMLYVGSYFYERGSAIYFGIPPELITITPSIMISMVIAFFIFAIILFFSCDFIISMMLKWTKSEKLIKCAVLLPVLLFWLSISYLNNDLSYRNILTSLLLYGILCLCIIVLSPKPLGNKKEDNEKKEHEENNSSDTSSSTIFSKKTYNFSGLIFWIGFIFLISTHSLGRNIAENANSYNGFDFNNEKYVIVKIYGDAYIAKKNNNGKLNDGIYIFKSDDFKSINIHKITLHGSGKKTE